MTNQNKQLGLNSDLMFCPQIFFFIIIFGKLFCDLHLCTIKIQYCKLRNAPKNLICHKFVVSLIKSYYKLYRMRFIHLQSQAIAYNLEKDKLQNMSHTKLSKLTVNVQVSKMKSIFFFFLHIPVCQQNMTPLYQRDKMLRVSAVVQHEHHDRNISLQTVPLSPSSV